MTDIFMGRLQFVYRLLYRLRQTCNAFENDMNTLLV